MTSRRVFGEALRRQREQRGISLDTISEHTKISASLLAALERGDCSRWPPGIYSRSYIRDYAQAIGLERDRIAAEFAECFADTAFPDGAPARVDPQPTPPAPAAPLRLSLGDEPADRRRALIHRAAVVILDLLLTVAVAAALALATHIEFWVALAGVALGWHAVGVIRGSSDTWELTARLMARRHAPREEPGTTEHPIPEAA